jgi:periplasmic protein TonB
VIIDRRIVACAVLSVVAHVALARTMRALPRRQEEVIKRTISIRVVSPPPPAEPPPEPASPRPPPTPKPVLAERVRAPRVAQVVEPAAPQDVPPPEHPPAPSPSSGSASGPIFGISMESTSQAGAGPSMPIGNTASPAPDHAGAAGDDDEGNGKDTRPVPAYEVTTMPLPQGRCVGKYTDEARKAAVEGTVVLDLVVGAAGRVTQVRVVSGLGHGLTAAAIEAARSCRFSPGQKGDIAVPVRIRDFKIRFLLQTDE